jgi:hypothetical protein
MMEKYILIFTTVYARNPYLHPCGRQDNYYLCYPLFYRCMLILEIHLQIVSFRFFI